MNCPHCGKPINAPALMGARGGAAGKGSAERSRLNSEAAKARWAKRKQKAKQP